MTGDVKPGCYRWALELVLADRVRYLPRAAGFHVVPTDADQQPQPAPMVLWEVFICGLITPVRPPDIAGYEHPRAVVLTARGHARLNEERATDRR